MRLEFRGVSKRYGAVEALHDVSVIVAPGRVTGVIGPNGAGKTTLVKILLGLARATSGAVLLDGVPLSGDAHRARIGYMPQGAHFPGNLSAAELIALLVDLRGGDAADSLAAARSPLVTQLALEPHLHKPLRALSGGTRQKVNAVLAFLFAPELLVLDEPTAGLDPIASGVLKDRIAAERAAGRTILLSSHVSSELEELADDVVFLLDGRVAFAGALEELLRTTRQPRLERAVAALMRTDIGAAARVGVA